MRRSVEQLAPFLTWLFSFTVICARQEVLRGGLGAQFYSRSERSRDSVGIYYALLAALFRTDTFMYIRNGRTRRRLVTAVRYNDNFVGWYPIVLGVASLLSF